MAITPADFENALVSCISAMDGGNYASARQYLSKAVIYFAILPDEYEVAGRMVKRDKTRLDNLNDSIDAHERASVGAGDVRMVPIGFGRVG